MVKIERWEKETDEEWAERLAYETAIANDTETTLYFVEDDPYNEDGFIVNYVGKDSMTWKEHPEGPFTCKQVLEWKKKAAKLEEEPRLVQKVMIHTETGCWVYRVGGLIEDPDGVDHSITVIEVWEEAGD